jgi:uncharacterized protein YjbI with pentapeptide repeats
MNELTEIAGGKKLQDLNLRKHEGKWDLRGRSLAAPSVARNVAHDLGDFAVVEGLTEYRGLKLECADFSGSQLKHLRLHNSIFTDCCFDGCNCQDWRVWESSFTRCTFRKTDLRGSSLGAVDKASRRRNVFTNVDFAETDLRDTAYTSAEFLGCVFKNAKLVKVDFQGSVFADCIFEGRLREVLFYDRGFEGKDLTPNEMLHVDCRHADFDYVEFRRLNLETIRFPEGDDYIQSDVFPTVLAAFIAELKKRNDAPSRMLAAGLANKTKWLGPQQHRGVFSKKHILSVGGQQNLELLLEITNRH